MWEIFRRVTSLLTSARQTQSASGSSLAIQATGDVHYGLTVSEVRVVALDVFKANFFDLQGAAKATASQRGAEITDRFLDRLQVTNPAGLERARDPDFQYALFNMQREYATSGDKDLGALLVNILAEHTSAAPRTVMHIVLTEALTVAPKLTPGQIATLSMIFLLGVKIESGLDSYPAFAGYIDTYLRPLIDDFETSRSTLQHLQYAGCGTLLNPGYSHSLETVFLINYPGLFSRGLTPDEMVDLQLTEIERRTLFREFHRDANLHQFSATTQAEFDELLKSSGVAEERRVMMINQANTSYMSREDIRREVEALAPFTERVFAAWSAGKFGNFQLTTVGIAIANANIERIVGRDFADLKKWVN